MSRLRRPILHSRFFFITTNLQKGLRPFNQLELELLTDCLARVRERVPVSICAYCMMPSAVGRSYRPIGAWGGPKSAVLTADPALWPFAHNAATIPEVAFSPR